MAGLGYRTFIAGEIHTAANVNGYLMDQAVMFFASAGARDTALPSPDLGMVANVAGQLQTYDGAGWRPLGPPKVQVVDITGLSVTVTSSTPTTITTVSAAPGADQGELIGLQLLARGTGFGSGGGGTGLINLNLHDGSEELALNREAHDHRGDSWASDWGVSALIRPTQPISIANAASLNVQGYKQGGNGADVTFTQVTGHLLWLPNP